MTPFQNPKDILTREEAAQLIRVHVATIDRARKSGDLAECGTPGRVRIERDELYRWFKERGRTQNGQT
jgi:excisionase family DNA binding protein